MPRYHTYKLRRRYGRGQIPTPVKVGGVVVVVALAGTGAHATTATHRPPHPAATAAGDGSGHSPARATAHRTTPSSRARVAIAWAEQQQGKPYLWGGTGPSAFDCSGLAMEAWAHAGVELERTSQEQFASEVHVAPGSVQPGDLVFFAGSDGTTSDPGHVALVVRTITATSGVMVEAYATGYDIALAYYGNAHAKPGDGTPVGFTNPDQGGA